jgi:hypothetical protein
MYLLITEEQLEILKVLNDDHRDRKIIPRRSINNNMIVNDDLLSDCNNPGDTWYDWKDWLLSLQPTDEALAPRSSPKPRPKQE